MRLIIFYFLLSTSAFGQKSNYRLGISFHYLSAIDYSVQSPDFGSKFKSTLRAYPSWEGQIAIPFTQFFRVETGYRFKQHTISYKNAYVRSGQWIETSHSFPIRVGLNTSLGHKNWIKKFTYSISSGFLFDIMQQSGGAPSIGSFTFNVNSPAGIYTYKEYYYPNEINQVKFSLSIDTYGQISYRLFKNVEVYMGYGYTQGFKTLAKGYYSIRDPTGKETTGSMTNKGTYRYSILGIRYFQQF